MARKPKEVASVAGAAVEKPKPAQDDKGRFVSGNIGGGRGKGSRNKLGESFLADMLADWQDHGVEVIKKVRKEKPDVYLKTVASILPQQLNVKVEPFDEMTDDQLRKHAEQLLKELGPVLAFATGGDVERGEDAQGGKPAGRIPPLH